MPGLTVTIITRDEADRLEEAVASVAFADEVVIVDSGSTDGTIELARRLTPKVFVREWPGFAEQKNFAAAQAAHDWIFSLDADERASPGLGQEVRGLLASGPSASAYRVPRVSFYLGRWIRSTDWYPDHQVRLYDRRAASWAGAHVHESVRALGPVGRLRHELLHLPYRDVSHHLRTIDRYTELAARQLMEEGRRVTLPGLVARPLGAFLRNYVLRGGWRDGGVGLVVSVLNSYYVFLKFARLWTATHVR
ncbi:MAG TPA: glycosyltransferase family 2 protein [Vicinamibacterales bacterium]|nr:glycosyltransferase family 2 protein [Vicinamibacterales bacterium]